MRVLFVCSGNRYSPNFIISNQAESIRKEGHFVEYFLIKGKGIIGYMNNILPLKRKLKHDSFDLIHAHYLYSCIIASLAGAKPLVTSFMGSDIQGSKQRIVRFLMFIFHWDKCIVKSEQMKVKLNSKQIKVIANGVNIDIFKPMDHLLCLEKLGWSSKKKNILFPADPKRPEKNYLLAERSLELVEGYDIQLHCLYSIKNSEVPCYLNACDLVLLTSNWEGSPNVIKEALACNCRIVSTDVGDVRWLMGNTEGCYLAEAEPINIAARIMQALNYKGKSNGRNRIIDLKLDAKAVAKSLISYYDMISKQEYDLS